MVPIILFLVMSLFAGFAEAGTVSRPAKSFGGTSFINGVVPQASDFNGDIDTVYGEFNGNIDNANVKSAAAIAATKINPDGFTTNIRTIHAGPCTILEESDQAADTKRWETCSNGSVFQLGTYTDANALQNNWLTITRANGGFTIGGTAGTNTVNGATTFNQTVTFTGGTSLTPTGMVSMYMGTSAPSGWLLMDGASNSCTGGSAANANLCTQLISLVASVNYKGTGTVVTVDDTSNEIIHTTHGHSVNDRVHFNTSVTLPAPLAAATVYCIISITADRYKISTTCGGAEVDITTTGTGVQSDYFNFVTPDARGRNVLGTGTGAGLTARVIGATGGEENHLLTGNESGTSVHGHNITDSGHQHNIDDSSGTDVWISTGGISNRPQINSINATGSNTTRLKTESVTTGISINSSSAADAGAAHNVLDPFLVMTYIIKL
jgi:microcystin-dependent protein